MKGLKKKILLKKYGEYGIPYRIAKENNLISMCYSYNLEEVKKLITECKMFGDSDLLDSDNVLIIMNMENFDIELTHYDINDGELTIGFFCCANFKKYDWQSVDFADLIANKDLFENTTEVFEEKMYNSMIDFIKKNNLKWSEKNNF